jgi:thiamine biosynthesis lipoprotein
MDDGCTVHFTAMASACEIHLAGAARSELEAAAARAIAEVQRIETKYSRYRDDSVVARINAAAGSGREVDIDDETASLLDFAAQLHAQSDGLFDITSGVLRRAWNFRAAVVPTAQQLEALLPLVGWGQVRRGPRSIGLPRAGMELDFGGFGKEYAADRAATLLMNEGLRHGYVNLGGDIRIVGARADGTAWRFGIQHPRDEHATIAGIELTSGALATSGDYERFFVHAGRRYCHVLDPRSGWPVTAWQSISVALPACVAAGALTTIAMLKGEAALAFLAEQRATYLAVDGAGQVFHSGL